MDLNFTTPVGRLVQGCPFELQTKDMQGNPLTVKTGPNKGQPTQKCFLGVAFPKTPGVTAFHQEPGNDAFAKIWQGAKTLWPQFFANGQCTNPKFAFKVIDGDGVDQHGKPWAEREGFAGHWVLRFESSFLPKTYLAGNYSLPVADLNAALAALFPEGPARKSLRGCYVRVAGSTASNGNSQNPGMFVNLHLVELAGVGPEIVGAGPDAASAFGAAPAVLPAGAEAVPTGAASSFPPASPPPPGAPTPPATPTPPAPATPTPPAPPAPTPPPYDGFMQAPPSPTYVMTPLANGATKEQFLAQGWTEEMLIQHGYMVQA